MANFDKSLMKGLLRGFTPGEKHYTHHFEFIDISSFKGKDNRPLLRKYLRHMEEKGYIKNHDLGTNIHQWSITQEGQDALALFEADYFIR